MTRRLPGPDEPSVAAVLGPLGAAVMRELWSHGEMSPADLIDRLATEDRRPAYTTVTTILTRLRDRGLVSRRRRGRAAAYRATVSEVELVDASSGRAVDDLLRRYGLAAMRHFAVRLADVDPDLQRALMELAAQRATDEDG